MITFKSLNDPQWGRLGNQLFNIASTLGIAYRNGQQVVFPPWKYSTYFKNSLKEGYLKNAKQYKYYDTFFHWVDLPEGEWVLEGFFVSEKYFENIPDIIREQFAPNSHVINYLSSKYEHILKKNPCSIHIRRGDYLKQSWDFPVQSIKYYKHAISQFPPDTTFVVFSDDISWCKKHFVGSNFHFVEDEEDIIDLFLMSFCKNHIISNSTFSWWGAWLNPSLSKIVYCPTRWFGPGVSSNPNKYLDDLCAKGFRPLSLPNENVWLINVYYKILHPALISWSSLRKKWIQLRSK